LNVGVAMAFGSTPVPEIARWSRAAEDAGAATVWLGEAWRELAVPLCAAALATERVELGAGVMQLFPAHPLLAALQAAQLQEVSGGRFSLGVGLGASFVVERWFGVAYERPLQRAREFIEVVRGALASRRGEPFSYQGEIFRTHRYRMPFADDQPDVPILLAAVGPRMLELAGEVADGVVLGAIHSVAYLEEVRHRLAVGAGRAGRDPAELRIHAFSLCAVTPERQAGRDLARASLAYSAQYPHYRRRLAAEGFAAEAEQIADRVRAHDQAAALSLVSDEMVDRFSIAGSSEDCLAAATALSQEIDQLVLTLVPFRIDEAEAARRVLDGVALLAGERRIARPPR
jgi:alkanesulfonate monooxygenase SsuD/methylene tetrahydromethanopterin reductase-like flavin-dependent oxidoreductase (luciferase family)